MNQELTFGYSPCPNDTFMFNAIATGKEAVFGCRIRPVLHDVETLNEMALDQKLDVSKLSFYAWLKVKPNYQLLGCGAAMGFGCGPVLIAKKRIDPAAVHRCRIVLPGRWTTAHLLLRLWAPDADQRLFLPYDQIFDALDSDQADCGVIIHESRFTFASAGFHQLVDLGAWWETQTGLPIPLGCIAARKTLGQTRIQELETTILKSIRRALDDPQQTWPYIRQYAQEMDPSVLDQHIATFVNDFSLRLPDTGRQAIAKLASMAQSAGVL